MKSRWTDEGAAAALAAWGEIWGEALALRVYSGRLLGREADLVLHGGGNTSVKALHADPIDGPKPALYIKASGFDLASIGPEGHTALDLERVRGLRKLDELGDHEMCNALRTRAFRHDAANPSVETLLHAFLSPRFIDHTHADAILALANRRDGAEQVRAALGEKILVLDYVLAGFALARSAAEALDANPGAEGLVLRHHGLVTWGETARDAYERTIALVTRAEEFLAAKQDAAPSGTAAVTSTEVAKHRFVTFAPLLRGLLARPTGDADRPWKRVVVRPLLTREVLGFVDAPSGKGIAMTPPLTTDHLIRTRPLPLWIDTPPFGDIGALRGKIAEAVEGYREAYGAYVARHGSTMEEGLVCLDPFPRVILVPGLGALCVGEDARAAGIARDITEHTLRVKAQIAPHGEYESLDEAHLFAMEYRGYQHAKLGTGPPGPLAGQVALVTGAAGAIGSGIARELLDQGAHVAVTDLSGDPLEELAAELQPIFNERVHGVALDVTQARSIETAFADVIGHWGGIDLVVINAGLAHASPLSLLDLEAFRRLERVNVEGTLLMLRQTGAHFEQQATGGDIVLVSTKNVFSPGAGFGAYSATKAAAHQLARIASLELAPLDVRVNMVAPDAVFSEGSRRSGLWAEVGPERMRARGLDAEGLERYYKDRNLLKARITARHVGRAVVFFATRQTPTTGATLPVDGGLPDATPR